MDKLERLYFKFCRLFYKRKISKVSNTECELKVSNDELLQKLYDQIQLGDIYFSDMPLPEEELQKIPEGHRQRPYLIVGKESNYLQAYACSSKEPKYLKCFEYYKLNKYIYHMKYDSYVLLNDLVQLQVENIKYYVAHIFKKDALEVHRRLDIARNYNLHHALPKVLMAEKGDIIRVDSVLYLVNQKDSSNLYTYRFEQNKNNRKEIPLLHNQKIWYVSIFEQKIFKAKEMYDVNDLIPVDQLDYLKEQKFKYKDKQSSVSLVPIYTYPIGTLFTDKDGNEYVYLCSNEGRDYGMRCTDLDTNIQFVRFKASFKNANRIIMKREELIECIHQIKNDNFHWVESLLNDLDACVMNCFS